VVVPMSRSHLPSLYRFAAQFDRAHSEFVKLHPPRETLEDMAWWKAALSVSWCGIAIKARPKEHPDTFFVDASTSWGIGLVVQSRWLAWPLLEGWRAEGRDIGWAEFVALELAVLTAMRIGIKGVTLVVHSDNQGVVLAFAAGYSRGPPQNAVLRRILILLYENDLWLQVLWIPSADNPADGPSRGVFPPRNSLAPFPPKLPQALRGLVGPSITAPPRNPAGGPSVG
jgi:hypothetical protein